MTALPRSGFSTRATHRPAGLLALAIVAAGTACPQALAQSSRDRGRTSAPPPRNAPAAPAPASPASRDASNEPLTPPALRTEPVTIGSLGLSLYLPEDSSLSTNRVAGGETKVAVKAPDNSWLIQVVSETSSSRNLSAGEVLDSILEQRSRWLAHQPIKPVVTDRVDNLVIGGLPAARAYFSTPTDTATTVTGYTLVSLGGGQFVIFQMDCPPANLRQAKLTYETIVAASQFRDPSEITAERRDAVTAGAAFLAGLSTEDLEATFDAEPRFYRVFVPSPTNSISDDTEIGFQRVSIRRGQLGEVDPSKAKGNWGAPEREFGYLVQVDARTFIRDETLSVGSSADPIAVDSRAMYFLSRDRLRETWSIKNEVRQGKNLDRYAQTVVRSDDRLTARVEGRKAEPEVVDWSLPEAGYISRVELYMLPRLVSARNAAGLLGFYHYDPRISRIMLRRDEFTRTDTGWLRVSRSSEDAAPETVQLDAKGNELRRSTDDGQVMEPITIEQLQKLWRQKGLPLTLDNAASGRSR